MDVSQTKVQTTHKHPTTDNARSQDSLKGRKLVKAKSRKREGDSLEEMDKEHCSLCTMTTSRRDNHVIDTMSGQKQPYDDERETQEAKQLEHVDKIRKDSEASKSAKEKGKRKKELQRQPHK